MQQNPAEAKKKFGSDPEINAFLMEFGRLMGDHFDSLHQASRGGVSAESVQAQQQATSKGPLIAERDSSDEPPKIAEIGPLHAEVLKRHKESTIASSR